MAAGVTVMAALRGRSLDFRGGDSVETGLLFCASTSGMLTFWSSGNGGDGFVPRPANVVSWTSGFVVPAIELSGMPVFLGGAGGGRTESKE